MEKWRLLDTGPRTAAENMALDEVVLKVRSQGLVPNTLRFLQFRPEAVLIGYHQCVEQEVRVDFCLKEGIDVNRRITGGGAILFDETQLGWELISSKRDLGFSLNLEPLFERICNAVVYALRVFGLDAKFRPKNDIEVQGRKISGTGGTEEGGAFLFQGTLLVDFDAERMLKALRIPTEKLKDKEIESLKERVTCLKGELGYVPSITLIKKAIKEGFEKVFGIELVEGELTEKEVEAFHQLKGRFESQDWINMRKAYGEYQALSSALKTKGGLIRVSLVLNTRLRRVQHIFITGDFFAYPRRAILDLEAFLRGARLEDISGIVGGFFSKKGSIIPGVSPGDFIQAINLAIEKVSLTRYGFTPLEANHVFTVVEPMDEVLKRGISLVLFPYCAKAIECNFRYKKDCLECGECTVGEGYRMAKDLCIDPCTVINFEDLEGSLMEAKRKGVKAFIGCCCEPFYIKHKEDFERIGLPGVLVGIDNITCYDLGKAREAREGRFEGSTDLKLGLLEKVMELAKNSCQLSAISRQKG